jgi:tetratricopeptide (TPR) repeat protein
MFHGLVEKEKQYRQAAKGLVPDAETTVPLTSVATAVQEGRALLAEGKFAEAEKKFIAAIGNDARAIDAYRGLASVYEDMKNVDDAIATLQFLVQLDPKDESTYRRLADLYKEQKNFEDAMDAAEQAVELGPNNPKNLDMLIELAILNQLKYKAQSSLDKLSKVNPDNQKLQKYQEEINAL